MYCSSCGVAVAQGLSFCNYCGAKLNGVDKAKSSDIRPESLIFAMMATFIFGLVAITVLVGVLKNALGLPVERTLALAILPFLIMLMLEGVFIRLLLRRNQRDEKSQTTLSREQVTNELDPAQARMLPEARPSVTEQTTRAFDPIYIDRKSD